MTLAEVIVASALMAMIMVGVYGVMHFGMQFYRLNATMNDRQREGLIFLARLNAVLQNTQMSLIYIDPPTFVGAGPTLFSPSRGLSYCDALNDGGKVEFSGNKLYWQAYGCFFRLPNGQVRFVRKPFAGFGNPNGRTVTPPRPDLSSPAAIPTNFTSTDGAILARDVTALNFTVNPAGQAMPNGLPSEKTYIDVCLECGRKGDASGYWVKLKSSVYPRN